MSMKDVEEASESNLDFSSFPLLRVDQLKHHKLSTLVSSEEELDALVRSTESEDYCRDSVIYFASRLIDEVRKEIADRRVQSLLLDESSELSINNKEADLSCLEQTNKVHIKQSKIDRDNRKTQICFKTMCRASIIPSANKQTSNSAHSTCLKNGQVRAKKYMSGSTGTRESSPLRLNRNLHTKKSDKNGTNNKTIQRSVTKTKKTNQSYQKNAIKKNKTSSFVVGVGSHSDGGFRGRARKASDALKVRSFEQSEAYKNHQLESQREERKKLASERLKVRRERRRIMAKRRKERALRAKRKREIEAEEEAKRVRDEMKIAAEEAKVEAEISGKSSQQAIFDAAAAAANVVQKTRSSTQSSESSESLSDLDESFSDSMSSSLSVTTHDTDFPNQHEMIEEQKHICSAIGTHDEVFNFEEKMVVDDNQILTKKNKNGFEKNDGSGLSVFENKDFYPNTMNDEFMPSPDSSEKHAFLPERNDIESHRQALSIHFQENESSNLQAEADGNASPVTSFPSTNKRMSELPSPSELATPCPRIQSGKESQNNPISINTSSKEFSLEDTDVDGERGMSCRRTEAQGPRRTKSSPNKANKNSASPALCIIANIGERYQFTKMYPSFATLFTRFYESSRSKYVSHAYASIGDTGSSVQISSALQDSDLKECLLFQSKLIPPLLEIMEEAPTSSSGDEPMNPISSIDDFHNADSSPMVGDRFFRVSSSREEVSSILLDALSPDQHTSSWKELPSGEGLGASWNLLWTWSRPKLDYDSLVIFQKINHFRHVRGLTRKDLLKKNIQRFCVSSGNDTIGGNNTNNASKLMPLTYVLPQEYNAFVAAFLAIQKITGNKSSNFWILKPVGLSRGRGISLVSSIEEVSYADPIVIQKYLLNPLLFHGYKFDLRLYILVTSFNPLEAFIYRQGFGRFGTKKFTTNPESIHDERIHLTNTSIQQHYWDNLDPRHPVHLAGVEGGGNKVALSWLFKKLDTQEVDTRKMWKRISDLCLKTLLSVEDGIPHQPNAFEVFGFDVIFDEKLSPWLIEVNSSPALSRETDLDARIKKNMIRDTINLLDPPAFNRAALLEICQRRSSLDRNRRNLWKSFSEKDQLEQDLREILFNKLPRRYGEMPRADLQGDYERLAPGTPSFERLKKASPSYANK